MAASGVKLVGVSLCSRVPDDRARRTVSFLLMGNFTVRTREEERNVSRFMFVQSERRLRRIGLFYNSKSADLLLAKNGSRGFHFRSALLRLRLPRYGRIVPANVINRMAEDAGEKRDDGLAEMPTALIPSSFPIPPASCPGCADHISPK